ncbi:MAG: magnetosome biogenesis CDF transporter MamM [Mariprofundus sp.]|nr:magnetosome biogenesis CDF transporter MamM [Mariprofundus sp.]
MISEKCVRCSQGVGWIGIVVNATLMIMKAFIGLISGSHALVADAMYSAKDLMTSLLVIIGVKISAKPLDKEHPYGHGKIEFVLTMFASVVFLMLTTYLLGHAIYLLVYGDPHKAPHIIALWAALISVAVNVFMYFYSRCIAVESNSPMTRTLSKHHHADATASGAVAFAIIGAHYFGMPWIDLVVAIFEALHLLYLGSDVFRDAARGLMDRTVDGPMREKIIEHLERMDEVEQIQLFRARQVGQSILVEIVLGLDPEISVNQANEITGRAKAIISSRVAHIGSLHISAKPATVEVS